MRSRALRGAMTRLRHPQTTVRWRLTLLYAGLFLVCGAALLAVTYTLVARRTAPNGPTVFTRLAGGPPPNAQLPIALGARRAALIQKSAATGFSVPPGFRKLLATKNGQHALAYVSASQRGADLNQLEVESGIALGIMAIISGLLGWLVAGRVLRPLRIMTATAQQISEANLHRRLAMPGPRDELRQLADTIDGLLARLEGAFESQRRFVANASHELRTPLTAARALLEMVITDPHATTDTFRETCTQVLNENEYQEQLIDALLTLARGQRGLDRHELFDLGATVSRVVRAQDLAAAASGVRIDASLEPALIEGDPRLVERLVANLVENAIRHNEWGGRVEINVMAGAGTATLEVSNTGPVVPPDEIDRLMQPFQRVARDRVGHGGGLGLGLSIVAAVATAHDAKLELQPRDEGGLRVEVRFRAADDQSLAGAPQLMPGDLVNRVGREGVDGPHPPGALEQSEPISGELQ